MRRFFAISCCHSDGVKTHAGLDYTAAPKAAWHALAEEGPARKIAAIKAYRDETGAGLAQAKKIAAAKRGVKRPAETIEKIRAGNLGREESDETRKRKRAAAKRRGAIPNGRRFILSSRFHLTRK